MKETSNQKVTKFSVNVEITSITCMKYISDNSEVKSLVLFGKEPLHNLKFYHTISKGFKDSISPRHGGDQR